LRTARFALEYSVLRAILVAGALLPRSVLLWTGACLGALLHATGFYRAIVRQNLAFVGIWSTEEQRRITRRLYRNMGRYAADLVRPASRLPPSRVENELLLAEQSTPARGVIGIIAHFGNWEILAGLLGGRVGRVAVVAKAMRNPFVEAWLRRRREQGGVVLIGPRHAVRQSLRILQQNGVVAILIDQYAGAMGRPATFLGKRTSTIRTVAGLAHRTGCGVIAAYALLQEDGTYRVVLQAPEPPAPLPEDDTAAVAALQEEHNRVVSAWIREHPDHWFGWFHRRFKDVLDYGPRRRL